MKYQKYKENMSLNTWAGKTRNLADSLFNTDIDMFGFNKGNAIWSFNNTFKKVIFHFNWAKMLTSHEKS